MLAELTPPIDDQLIANLLSELLKSFALRLLRLVSLTCSIECSLLGFACGCNLDEDLLKGRLADLHVGDTKTILLLVKKL